MYEIPSYWHLGRYLRTLKQLFRENRYPIVHSHIGVISVFPLYAAMRAGVPIRVVHNHTTTAKGERRNALMYILRPFAKLFATHFIAVSDKTGIWLFGRRAMERGEVTIFDPIIQTKKFQYDAAVRAQVRSEMSLDGKFVVGHAGRFCYQKNQEFLLDVFQAIRAKQPNALLMMIGSGDNMAEIAEKADKMGLRDSILMLGHRSDIHRLYQAMDIFVFPSRYEGFGLVAVEAQLAGLKVIASSTVPLKVKIRDDMTYLDLTAGVERWAEEVLKASAGERVCVGDFSPFDMTIQAKRMERYYLELLQGVKEKT